jgi:hypothetical protein
MKLILSLIPKEYSNIYENKYLLYFDTDEKKGHFLDIEVPQNIYRANGMCYSGDVFVAALNTLYNESFLLMIKKNRGYVCSFLLNSAKVHDVVSASPGQLFLNSTEFDCMDKVTFNPNNLNVMENETHFSLNRYKKDLNHFSSLCCFNLKWYGALFGPDWSNEKDNGTVVDLTNKKVIYCNLKQPHSLFFNSEERICFCESENSKFHFGNKIVKLFGYVRGAIEDKQKMGYWVAISKHRTNNERNKGIKGVHLVFVSYKGEILDNINIDFFAEECYSIIEAHDYLI